MSPFEYITVLISIILGLGITQIVTGVADLIHQWNRVKIYWPHLLWIVLVFFLHIQEWWWLYELRGLGQWRLPTFLFVILYPISLFILARILFPLGPIGTDAREDLKSFYFSSYPRFFLLLSILATLSILEDTTIQGYRLVDEAIQIAILLAALLIAIVRPAREWVHQLFVIAMVLVVVISFAVQWNKWLVQ